MFNLQNRIVTSLSGKIYDTGGQEIYIDPLMRSRYYNELSNAFPQYLQAYDKYLQPDFPPEIYEIEANLATNPYSYYTKATSGQREALREQMAKDLSANFSDTNKAIDKLKSSFPTNGEPGTGAASEGIDSMFQNMNLAGDYANTTPPTQLPNNVQSNLANDPNGKSSTNMDYGSVLNDYDPSMKSGGGITGPAANATNALDPNVGKSLQAGINVPPLKFPGLNVPCLGQLIPAFQLDGLALSGALSGAIAGDICEELVDAFLKAADDCWYFSAFTFWFDWFDTKIKKITWDALWGGSDALFSQLNPFNDTTLTDAEKAEAAELGLTDDPNNMTPEDIATYKSYKSEQSAQDKEYQDAVKSANDPCQQNFQAKYDKMEAKKLVQIRDAELKKIEDQQKLSRLTAEEAESQKAKLEDIKNLPWYKAGSVFLAAEKCKIGLRWNLKDGYLLCNILKALSGHAMDFATGNANPIALSQEALAAVVDFRADCYQDWMNEAKELAGKGMMISESIGNLAGQGSNPAAMSNLIRGVAPAGTDLFGVNPTMAANLNNAIQRDDLASIEFYSGKFLQTQAFDPVATQYLLTALNEYGQSGDKNAFNLNLLNFIKQEGIWQQANNNRLNEYFQTEDFDMQNQYQNIYDNYAFPHGGNYYYPTTNGWSDNAKDYKLDELNAQVPYTPDTTVDYYNESKKYNNSTNDLVVGGPNSIHTDPSATPRVIGGPNSIHNDPNSILKPNELSSSNNIFLNIDTSKMSNTSKMKLLARLYGRVLGVRKTQRTAELSQYRKYCQRVQSDINELKRIYDTNKKIMYEMTRPMREKIFENYGFFKPSDMIAELNEMNKQREIFYLKLLQKGSRDTITDQQAKALAASHKFVLEKE